MKEIMLKKIRVYVKHKYTTAIAMSEIKYETAKQMGESFEVVVAGCMKELGCTNKEYVEITAKEIK